jgi:hypothetical protein
LELILSFTISFVLTWFVVRNEFTIEEKKDCPMKASIMNLARVNTKNKILRKELKEYSLLKIQQGHFEYKDVLETLKLEKNYDKART